jgi:hypothetical protein
MAEPTTPLRRPSRVSTPESRASIQTSESTSGEIAFDVFVKDIASGSDQARLALAQQLKDAGFWKGKISSKFNIKYYTALLELEKNHQGQVALDKMIGSTTSVTRYDVLVNTIAEGGSGSGGPTTIKDITVYTPETAKTLIDSVIRDTLGRKATAAEIKKYTSALKGIQEQAASSTKYSGTNNQNRVTTPGLNEQQYLIDQVSGTDEAKANKVLGFYDTFMNALGGR